MVLLDQTKHLSSIQQQVGIWNKNASLWGSTWLMLPPPPPILLVLSLWILPTCSEPFKPFVQFLPEGTCVKNCCLLSWQLWLEFHDFADDLSCLIFRRIPIPIICLIKLDNKSEMNLKVFSDTTDFLPPDVPSFFCLLASLQVYFWNLDKQTSYLMVIVSLCAKVCQ